MFVPYLLRYLAALIDVTLVSDTLRSIHTLFSTVSTESETCTRQDQTFTPRSADDLLEAILQASSGDLTLAAHWLTNLQARSPDTNVADGLVGDVLCAVCYGATVLGIETVMRLTLDALTAEVTSNPTMVMLK